MSKSGGNAPTKYNDLVPMFNRAVGVVENTRQFVGNTANLAMCVSNFELGRIIFEQEQNGKDRAGYGDYIISGLSQMLNEHFGRGFSQTNLKNARFFFLSYQNRIGQSAISQLQEPRIGQSAIAELSQFKVGWTHYLVLMRIKDEKERAFYEIETAKQNWSVKQLQRNYASSLYERVALSRDKNEVMRLANEGQTVEKPQDILKTPLVLEFLGMPEHTAYSESDLETAIIDKLQDFLLELGKGFLFEARQKRFTYDEDDFFVDLVFYNRILRCYVLIDIKTTKIKHQDLGQMQMYVNYFDRHVKQGTENPTIGILLCKDKNNGVVEMTLPKDANIYANEYSLYLPDKKLLQSKLAEWVNEFENSGK